MVCDFGYKNLRAHIVSILYIMKSELQKRYYHFQYTIGNSGGVISDFFCVYQSILHCTGLVCC